MTNRSNPPHRSWGALLLDVPAAIEDEICGELTVGPLRALGARLDPSSGGHSRLTVYLPTRLDSDAILARVDEVLGRHGLDRRRCDPRLESVEDEAWVERYQASLQPFPLGTRFRIWPRGNIEPVGDDDGRAPIWLIPGRAFGTGEHATTGLCVRELEERVRPGSRWVDLGCGTALLALVAVRCGAGEVLAVDVDADAVDVARDTLRTNGAERQVRLLQGVVDSVRGGEWDGVVVNISAPFFEHSAERLSALLRPGGILIASGFRAQAAQEVRRTLVEIGFAPRALRVDDGWAAVILVRPAV